LGLFNSSFGSFIKWVPPWQIGYAGSALEA
jgi:hypothetical protein